MTLTLPVFVTKRAAGFDRSRSLNSLRRASRPRMIRYFSPASET